MSLMTRDKGARTTHRAETVGSLLRPPELLDAMAAHDEGRVGQDELRALQDAAVLDALRLQESVGLDVVTDGEMRRTAWAMSPYLLDCLDMMSGARSYPASLAQVGAGAEPFPIVVRPLQPPQARDLDEGLEFFLDNASGHTKFTLPAPSYHRRYWSDRYSREVYSSCEEYLIDVRDWIRGVAARIAAAGCGYIQLDAPNYGSLCDRSIRDFHASVGHDLDAQIAFDGALDASVFDGLSDVTSAVHVCRGNLPGGKWFSSGGYAVLAEDLFPLFDVDSLLLEFDSDRAGDFAPLKHVAADTVAVLGLITTKSGEVEDPAAVEERIRSAASVLPLERLALSTQCGFASVAGGNPVADAQQREKLEMVVSIARRVWPE